MSATQAADVQVAPEEAEFVLKEVNTMEAFATLTSKSDEKKTTTTKVYLDVRTQEEYNEKHVKLEEFEVVTLNIPVMNKTSTGRVAVSEAEFEDAIKKAFPDKENTKFLVGCRTGERSKLGCQRLNAIGYKDATNVGGGIVEWIENGLPIE
jgi:rhodanese-related sulfurtransferase